MPDIEALLSLAVDVATDASGYLASELHRVRVDVGTKSSATDMVSEVDRATEHRIVDRLRRARPDDGVLGEELGADAGSSGVRWIVDPLDGTTNYLYGFPAFAVSVAAEVGGEVVVGAVADVAHSETFTARKGAGAWCDGRRLAVIGAPALATALVGTGFSYLPERRQWQAEQLTRLLPAVRDIRRAGAASIDLCWVAAGRLDAFYERWLAYWDWAAGALIAREAGAVVTVEDDLVVAEAPSIAGQLRRLLDEAAA